MYLALNTKFNPFTYAEMVQPLLYYKDAYEKTEAAYEGLAYQTEAWKDIANQQNSPEAYAMYKKYSDDLKSVVDDFSRGMTAGNRRQLLNMKRRYAKEISPIERAYKRKEALEEEQRKAMQSDPTLRYQRMASNMSIDSFIDNPSADYGRSYSGALLAKQVGQAAANYAKTLAEQGKLESIGLPMQYTQRFRHGASPEEVMQAISQSAAQGNSRAVDFLVSIRNQVLQSSGVADWANETTMREFTSFANQGLYNALGQTEVKNYTDQAGMDVLHADLQDRNAIRTENRKAARGAQENDRGLYDSITQSAESFLQTSGELSKYSKALSGLKAGANGVRASIFGKTGKANPLKVYDELQSSQKQAEEKVKREYSGRIKSLEDKELAARRVGIDYIKDSSELAKLKLEMGTKIIEARKKAESDVFKKHGVSGVVTKDQYDVLKKIGYNGGTTLAYTDLSRNLDKYAQSRSYYSTNMSEYNIPHDRITGRLANWDINKSFSGAAYILNSDGTQGKSVKFKDLNLYSEDNTKGKHISGIYYSAFTPDKVIIQVGAGNRYIIDPNALGGEVGNFIRESARQIQNDPNVNLTEASVAITGALSKMLNSYNPVAPKSSAKESGR